MVLTLLGGIGLFLLGIHMMTEGIRGVSGSRLRQILERFASRRGPAFLTGLSVTAVIQSANATIIMTMGFVAAGLIALPQSLAVVIGANVGTTSTAWIVAVLGLRFSLAPAALVVVLVGALLRISGRGMWKQAGTIAAGFGLLLLGIDFMQTGMVGLAPDLQRTLPESGLLAALMLLGIGIVATVAAQSSSVAIAATLTALSVGGIDLRQGALLAIGHNLGTTVTAFLASISAGPAGRRAALAHFLFNGTATVLALLLLAPFLSISESLARELQAGAPIALAVFHTIFNVVGALVMLPFLDRLARVVERVFPEKGPPLAKRLDPLAQALPGAALEAARLTLVDITMEGLAILRSRVQHGRLMTGTERRLDASRVAWDRTRAFLTRLPGPEPGVGYDHTVRVLDHLEGLLQDAGATDLRGDAFTAKALAPCTVRFRDGMATAEEWLQGARGSTPAEEVAAFEDLRARVDDIRSEVMTSTTMGEVDLVSALAQLDALRWMADQSWHLERILEHLVQTPSGDEGPQEGAG